MNQYIDNPMQNRQAHSRGYISRPCPSAKTRRVEKCVYSYALNVLLNVFFFASKAPNYEGRIYVPIKCQVCFEPKMSRTRLQIVLLVLF